MCVEAGVHAVCMCVVGGRVCSVCVCGVCVCCEGVGGPCVFSVKCVWCVCIVYCLCVCVCVCVVCGRCACRV